MTWEMTWEELKEEAKKMGASIYISPFEDNFEYWLAQSKYGQQLLAFINAKTITPNYFGGSFVRVL